MKIETLEQLRVILGHPNETTKAKIHAHLTPQAIGFIGRSPLVIMATADQSGMPTASPRRGSPGFVHVEENDRLLIPERLCN
jgi:hypothetical protein